MKLETFFTVSEQTMQFLMSAVLGAALGILYDCFRVVRIIFPYARKKAAVCAADILFMLCSGAAYFLFSAVFCRGVPRFYCVIGAASGFALYILTVGNLITGIIRYIAGAVYEFLQKVYYYLFAPIVNILKRIYIKVRGIFVHSYENMRKAR